MTTELDDLAVKYRDYLDGERVPANTIRTRVRTLRAVEIPGTITREDLEAWWRDRADEVSPATRANDLANLRAFYKWCSIWEHRLDDPTARLRQPKVGNRLPRPMSRADLHRVLDHVREHDDLRRAVCLGAYAGLRISEAATLHWRHIDLESRRAHVLESKGGKSRSVALSALLIDQLLPDTGGNVVSGTATANSPAQLQRRVNRAIQAAGVDGTSHQLRHRYGTVGYRATGDLLALGRQMGHAAVQTTAVYAAESDEVADRIAEAVVR